MENFVPEDLKPFFSAHSAQLSREDAYRFIEFVQKHPKLFYKQKDFVLSTVLPQEPSQPPPDVRGGEGLHEMQQDKNMQQNSLLQKDHIGQQNAPNIHLNNELNQQYQQNQNDEQNENIEQNGNNEQSVQNEVMHSEQERGMHAQFEKASEEMQRKIETASESSSSNDTRIIVYDVVVKCRGPDDKIYLSPNTLEVEKFRKWITRGCALVHHTNLDLWFLFQGFAKFSGSIDEDDDDIAQAHDDMEIEKLMQEEKRGATLQVPQQRTPTNAPSVEEPSFKTHFVASKTDIVNPSNTIFFTDKLSNTSQVLEVEKVNGKAAHFGVFNAGGERFFLAGSKNNHIVFRNRHDLPKDQMHMLHFRIGHLLLDMLESVSHQDQFVASLEQSGLLLNFELLLIDDQHVVDYKLNKDTLIFLAFTPRTYMNDDYQNGVGKCLPVHVSLQWLSSLNIPTPRFTIHPFSRESLSSLVNSIRVSSEKDEGRVLYFLDAEKRTIGLWKVKTSWYITLRAIREKVVNMYKDFNLRVQSRLRQLRNTLSLSEEEFMSLAVHADQLHKFIKAQVREQVVEESVQAIRENFAKLYSKFLETKQGWQEEDGLKENFQNITLIDDDPLDMAKECKKRRQSQPYRKNKRQRI